ncbi:hypothetical protein EVAR_13751_1 [Eumeta japonica]|uniref:Uncharacterized protein n=1 Tax=Eumeta variegata TaxID=151549 RepID=A0A4C1UBF1_EUMVA|nr:hypothetical protein EVAR_13751_1 [Eumeta japonica]
MPGHLSYPHISGGTINTERRGRPITPLNPFIKFTLLNISPCAPNAVKRNVSYCVYKVLADFKSSMSRSLEAVVSGSSTPVQYESSWRSLPTPELGLCLTLGLYLTVAIELQPVLTVNRMCDPPPGSRSQRLEPPLGRSPEARTNVIEAVKNTEPWALKRDAAVTVRRVCGAPKGISRGDSRDRDNYYNHVLVEMSSGGFEIKSTIATPLESKPGKKRTKRGRILILSGFTTPPPPSRRRERNRLSAQLEGGRPHLRCARATPVVLYGQRLRFVHTKRGPPLRQTSRRHRPAHAGDRISTRCADPVSGSAQRALKAVVADDLLLPTIVERMVTVLSAAEIRMRPFSRPSRLIYARGHKPSGESAIRHPSTDTRWSRASCRDQLSTHPRISVESTPPNLKKKVGEGYASAAVCCNPDTNRQIWKDHRARTVWFFGFDYFAFLVPSHAEHGLPPTSPLSPETRMVGARGLSEKLSNTNNPSLHRLLVIHRCKACLETCSEMTPM